MKEQHAHYWTHGLCMRSLSLNHIMYTLTSNIVVWKRQRKDEAKLQGSFAPDIAIEVVPFLILNGQVMNPSPTSIIQINVHD